MATKDELFRGYAEVVGWRLGVRADKTEMVLRSLDPSPSGAYCSLVDKLSPIEKSRGRIAATMALVMMIRNIELGW